MLGIERVGFLKSFQKSPILLAFVSAALGEAALHLPDEVRSRRASARADDKEVVRIEAEMLGLEMDFGNTGIGQEGGMLEQELASQYAATCCSKNTPSPPVEIGLETRFLFRTTPRWVLLRRIT